MSDQLKTYNELRRLGGEDKRLEQAAKDMGAENPMMFVKGQKDCRDGKAHESGKGESYDMGYRFEYELEQILGAKL